MKHKLFFPSKSGKTCGIYEGTEPTASTPASILVHGYSTSKASKTIQAVDSFLVEQGHDTLCIDLYGHGESEGTLSDLTVQHAVDSVVGAYHYMETLGYRNIGFFASSFGALPILFAVKQLPAPVFIILKGPVCADHGLLLSKVTNVTPEEWEEQGILAWKDAQIPYSYYTDAQMFNAYEIAHNISTKTLIIHGGRDTTVPVEQSKKLMGKLPNAKLHIVKNAEHKFTPDQIEEMLEQIKLFLD